VTVLPVEADCSGKVVPVAPVVVFLPVRDERATVAAVVARVPRQVGGHRVEIVVVDDGSTDGSAALAVAAGADVVAHQGHRGLGAAVRTGLAVAARRGAVAAAFLDADGEYDPGELPRLLAPILDGTAEYVVGSRFAGTIESMRPHRRVGNRVLTLVTSAFAGRRLSDAQSGFRALGSTALRSAQVAHDYNYAQVLTLDLLRQGFRYREVPITYRRRAHGRSFVRLGTYLCRVLPAMVAARRGPRPSRGPAGRLAGWRLWATAFLLIAAAGQLAVGMRASRTASVTGDEPFYLLTMQSLLSDSDLDLRDEYAGGEESAFWDGSVTLWKQMVPLPDGRLLSPHDPGLPVLALPAYAVGGVRGVQRFLVLLWAGALACGAVLARRAGAPAWAAATAAVALGAGAPGVVYASQVYPEGAAALAVATGLLAATGSRARPVLLAVAVVGLAWLGVKYLPLGAVAVVAFAWRHRGDRRALAVAAALLVAGGGHAAWWHLQTFGGLTPYGASVVWPGQGTASILGAHLDVFPRGHRLAGLFLDARFGLIGWAPVAALAFAGLRRAAAVHIATVAGCVAMAAFVSITMMGWWFPGRMLVAGFPALAVLAALGAARLPRPSLVLAAWSSAISVAVVVATRTGRARLAVDPWVIGWPRLPAGWWPDFRTVDATSSSKTAAWVTGAVVLTILAGRRARSREGGRHRPSGTALTVAILGLALVLATVGAGEDRPRHVTSESAARPVTAGSGLPAPATGRTG